MHDAAKWAGVARKVAYGNLALIGVAYVVSLWPPAGPSLSVISRVLWIPVVVSFVLALVTRKKAGYRVGAGILRAVSPPPSGRKWTRQGGGKSTSRRAFGNSSPKWLQVIGLTSLISIVVNLVFLPGTPYEEDGQYFVRHKATTSVVSQSSYLLAHGWQSRAFLSIGAFFTVLALYYLDDRRYDDVDLRHSVPT